MVYHFFGLCGCIAEYFYSRSFEECSDLIFKDRSGQEECREGCFVFEHSSWTVRPFEDENTMVSLNVGNQIPQNSGYHTTRKCRKPHNHHAALCYATLQTVCCCLRSEFLSSRRNALSRFDFLSPDLSLCLLGQFYLFDSVWQNVFEISVHIRAWHRQFKVTAGGRQRIRATVLWSILPLVEMGCRETYCALM